jgi:hypothetical protein
MLNDECLIVVGKKNLERMMNINLLYRLLLNTNVEELPLAQDIYATDNENIKTKDALEERSENGI